MRISLRRSKPTPVAPNRAVRPTPCSPAVVREVEPPAVPIAGDEVGSIDEWMRSLRRPGEPRVLSRPTYVLLDEARAEAE